MWWHKNQIICSNGWCYLCHFDYVNDDCEYYLDALCRAKFIPQRQVGIFASKLHVSNLVLIFCPNSTDAAEYN